MPKRIQRKRTKGWRMPENTVYVGRGSRWGNPWVVGKVTILTGKRAGERITAKDAVRMFRNTVNATLARTPEFKTDLESLRGKNLACWCPLDLPCHADALLELATPGEAGT